MKLDYLDLFHGPSTVIDKQDVFNHRFSQFSNFNFTYLMDEIDDFDLFHLIQEESDSNLNHKKNYIQFALPSNLSHHLNLFETLHFDLYESVAMQSINNPLAKAHDNITLLDEAQLNEWIQFQMILKEIEPTEEAQFKDLCTLYFKQKAHKIYIMKDNDLIVASILTHQYQGKTFLDDYTSSNDQYLKPLLEHLISLDEELIYTVDTDSFEFDLLQDFGFKIINRTHVCIKYL